MEADRLLTTARAVITAEADALYALAARLGPAFAEVVGLLYATQGRVVVTGIGKSAHIGQKMVATFNSTGTPALFLHAAEALHGDLGMVLPNDTVLCLSKSGATPEVKTLVPLIKQAGVPLVAVVGATESYLAQQADHVLDVSVSSEADPNNLAPTTSTTATLAMGDALAVALIHLRQFSGEDFARYHPGGALGKRLYLTVADLVHTNAPRVALSATLKEVILAISQGRLGATLVVTEAGALAGIITDGDLRRLLERTETPFSARAADLVTRAPKTVPPDLLAYDALQLLEQHNITQLVVAHPSGGLVGLVHLHDILNEGIR